MNVCFLPAVAAALSAAFVFTQPANAATYTYDIDYDFPILRRGNQLGSASRPIAGRGSVQGTITLDDDFLTTRTLLSYDLTTYNTSTASNVENSYSFSSSDPAETFAFVAPSSVWDPDFDLSFNDQSYAQPCSGSSPTGARGAYSIAGSNLILRINSSFTPGDAGFSMLGRELFGRTKYCSAVGYPLFEHEHTAPNASYVQAGTLASTGPGTGANGGGTDAMTPVPLPAGLPLLLASLSALFFVRRRSTQA